jgi:integrase
VSSKARVFVPAARSAFPARTKTAEARTRRDAEANGRKPPNPTTVSPVRFHDAGRHTCAAWLIDKGAHPLQIKLRLGHESIKTTLDTYGHLFPTAEPELADLLDTARAAALAENNNVTALRRH